MKNLRLYTVCFFTLFITVFNLKAYTPTHIKEKQAKDSSDFTIPIKIYNDLILIEGSIADTKGYFVWVNGFSFTAINSNLKISKESFAIVQS